MNRNTFSRQALVSGALANKHGDDYQQNKDGLNWKTFQIQFHCFNFKLVLYIQIYSQWLQLQVRV